MDYGVEELRRFSLEGSAFLATVIVATVLLSTNLIIHVNDVSSLPANASDTTTNLIKLGIVIAAWPWWAFASFLVFVSALYLLYMMKAIRVISDGQRLLDRFISVEKDQSNVREHFNNHRGEVDRVVKRLRDEMLYKINFIDKTKEILLEAQKISLLIAQQEVKPRNGGSPIFGWKEWYIRKTEILERISLNRENMVPYLGLNWGKQTLGGPIYVFDDNDRKLMAEHYQEYLTFTNETSYYLRIVGLFQYIRDNTVKINAELDHN